MNQNKEKAVELYRCQTQLIQKVLKSQNEFFESELGKFNVKDINVIKVLGFTGLSKMSGIAEKMNMADSTLTGIVDNLVKKKFVERKRTEQDRRVVKICLTEKGIKVFENLNRISIDIFKDMLTALDEEEQDTFVTLFRKISEHYLDE